MKHNQKKTAFLFLWLFICMLVCLGTGLLAVSRSEASFYKRAAVMAACAPEKAGEMMRSLKREQPEKVEKGEALLKQYGYEAGLFTRADSAGLLSILLLFFLLLSGGGALWYAMESRRHRWRIQELSDYMIRINNGIYDTGIGNREDEYSRLQDEIYKTMITMRESREEAKKREGESGGEPD